MQKQGYFVIANPVGVKQSSDTPCSRWCPQCGASCKDQRVNLTVGQNWAHNPIKRGLRISPDAIIPSQNYLRNA